MPDMDGRPRRGPSNGRRVVKKGVSFWSRRVVKYHSVRHGGSHRDSNTPGSSNHAPITRPYIANSV